MGHTLKELHLGDELPLLRLLLFASDRPSIAMRAFTATSTLKIDAL
jgi:hypothetical protein